jgi:hypothetical protein
MIQQIKNYLIAAGALMIIGSYFTDDAMRKIDCGMIGLGCRLESVTYQPTPLAILID